jgi:phosphatidylserine/phosphatidylglycerophosphate/cardiolipin synthase-like enzyme
MTGACLLFINLYIKINVMRLYQKFMKGVWKMLSFFKKYVALGALLLAAASQSAWAQIEVGFSPRGGAEELVLKAISAAQSELLVMAYSFTSAPVTDALLQAKRRGVSVRMVVDYGHNANDKSGRARAALSALKTAGVDVRTTSQFPIHHDKVIIVDRKSVQTGSFNYSAAAAKTNSENVVVIWNRPDVAGEFERHFVRNWQGAQEFVGQY